MTIGPIAVNVESLGARARQYHAEVTEFVREEIIPVEQELREHTVSEDWQPSPRIEQLKQRAKSAGLWNLFIPKETDPDEQYGAGLTNLEYAHICEVMGLSPYAPEVNIMKYFSECSCLTFRCSTAQHQTQVTWRF